MNMENILKNSLRKAETYRIKKFYNNELLFSHLMYSILNDAKINSVIDLLDEINVDKFLLTDEIEAYLIAATKDNPQPTKSKHNYNKILNNILDYAHRNKITVVNKKETSVIDVFLAALEIDNELTDIFNDHSLTVDRLKDRAIDIEAMRYTDWGEYDFQNHNIFEQNLSSFDEISDDQEYLNKYCNNFNQLALDKKIDACYGRSKEMDSLYRVLLRSRKSNPILIGREGVGKTNLVEGLAYNIIKGHVPSHLKNKVIYSLNLNSLVSGTKYRGMFEERVENILKELDKLDNIILFIDEIHTIIGAGNSEGSTDLSNILKPYISRNSFQLIGATTTDEYKKYIEKDKALKRRFSEILIKEPKRDVCVDILQKIKLEFEEKHNVIFTKEAIEGCVDLSSKYITYRTLPDKAIDIMDDVAVKKRLSSTRSSELKALENQYKSLELKKINVVTTGQYEQAEGIKSKTDFLLKEIKKEKIKEKRIKNKTLTIDYEDVLNIIQEITNIPLTNNGVNIGKLKTNLQNNVIGQGEAIDKVVKTFMVNKLNLDEHEKPIGSFLFVGYSGVGKTQITKEISKSIFGNESAVMRIDCSEYAQPHEISKLIGSPAGYVGYQEGGILTEHVKRNPFTIVLFDEIEKAHNKLFDILLQVLGEGRLTNSFGETIDFKNTIIVMTSNVGTKQLIHNKSSIGYSKSSMEDDGDEIILQSIKAKFRPEFVNRIDNIVHFNALSKDVLKILLNKDLDKLIKKLHQDSNITLNVSEEVKDKIINDSYMPQHGYRPVKRKIHEAIKSKVAEIMIVNSVEDITFTLEGDKIETYY